MKEKNGALDKTALLPIFSGLLFLLALPPVGFAVLVFVCFVPLLLSIHESTVWQSLGQGFLFGVVSYICIPMSLLSGGWNIVAYSILISGGFFALLVLIIKVLARIPVFGSVWVSFPLSFALLQVLGESVLSVPVLLSVIYPFDLIDGGNIFWAIGGRGVDYLVCGINGLIAGLLLDGGKQKTYFTLAGLTTIFMALHFVSWNAEIEPTKVIEVIAIDNDISPQRSSRIKYSIEEKKSVSAELDALTKEAVSHHPDLILWPEAGSGLANRQVVSRRNFFEQLALSGDYRLLAGGISYDEKGREYSVADYIVNGKFVAQTQKHHMVPILESSLMSGSNTVLRIDNNLFGVGICFDVAFSSTISSMIDGGAAALIILSNDASFGYSGLTYMHLRYAAVRSAESAREILFLSNTGPSVVFAKSGRVKTGYIHSDGPRSENHSLSLYKGLSFYSRHTFFVTCSLLIFITVLLISVRRV